MTHLKTIPDEKFPDAYHDVYSKTVFGFWVYLLTDFILFGTLFATYSVLRGSTFGGPSPKELFQLPFTLTQTLFLLTSSFTVGLAGAYAHRKDKQKTIALFLLTFFLGIAFMGMELTEFSRILSRGYSWKTSAFLSAYFTLIATHGIHMIFALLWVIVLILPVWRRGLTAVSVQRLTCLRMFWQFLNIVWVFIFTAVYLVGSYD